MIDTDASNKLIESLDSSLTEFASNLQVVNVEHEIAAAESLGSDALRNLVGKYVSQHVQLGRIKTKCKECIAMWEDEIYYHQSRGFGLLPNAPIEGPPLITQFKERYEIACRLQVKYKEILWNVAPAYYITIVNQSRTSEEIRGYLEAYKRSFDDISNIEPSKRSETHEAGLQQATIMLQLYSEAITKLEDNPIGHSKRLIKDLDVELDNLANELQTIDLKSEPVVTQELEIDTVRELLRTNHNRQKRVLTCQERCRSEMIWWNELANKITETEAQHFISEFSKRHETASYLLPKYKEIVQHFLLKFGRCTVAKFRSRAELERELGQYQRTMQTLNETESASLSRKDEVAYLEHRDEVLMMIEFYKEAISKAVSLHIEFSLHKGCRMDFQSVVNVCGLAKAVGFLSLGCCVILAILRKLRKADGSFRLLLVGSGCYIFSIAFRLLIWETVGFRGHGGVIGNMWFP